MKKILFLTEANSEIGMGHIYQSIALAENLQEFDIYFAFPDFTIIPDIIKNATSNNISFYHNILNIEAIVNNLKPDFVFYNFRNFPEGINKFLFFDKKIKTIVYDDIGGIELACNLLVNYTFSKKQKKYSFYSSKEETYFFSGADFFPLRKEFYGIKKYNETTKIITIFMGGSDRSNVSDKIADDILNHFGNKFSINIIAGKANKNIQSLRTKYLKNENVKIFENISNIAEVFSKSYIVINPGGSAMYELAFLGIPVIILWEDEHEKELAQDFNNKGFSQTAGQCETYKTNDLYKNIEFLSDKKNRERQKMAGMQLVDGKKGLTKIKKYLSAE